MFMFPLGNIRVLQALGGTKERCVINSMGVTRRAISRRGTGTAWCQHDWPLCSCDAKIEIAWSVGCTSWTSVWLSLPACLYVFPRANYRIWNVFVSFGLWLHLLSVCVNGDITRNNFCGFENVCTLMYVFFFWSWCLKLNNNLQVESSSHLTVN